MIAEVRSRKSDHPVLRMVMSMCRGGVPDGCLVKICRVNKIRFGVACSGPGVAERIAGGPEGTEARNIKRLNLGECLV